MTRNRLQFGIPSFDALFGRESPKDDETAYDYAAHGIRLPDNHQTTSLCFIGPDGTGKSVFGLHLAAQYTAHACENLAKDQISPLVLYVSTDLKHDVAEVMWKNFGLEEPNKREFPFYWGYRTPSCNIDQTVKLERLDPGNIQSALEVKCNDPLQSKVHFVDLVSKTMGDDWSFINRLLAVLKPQHGGCRPHLLIIDAVEGFETLVGEKDAFGETTSRRARIAQIMRTAGEKCHVCFIVEEPKSGHRFPEEFVTDIVVRLRTIAVKSYARRTVEIVKARGQQHIRGQHAFAIRGGGGSTTGLQENADEPKVANAYVLVYPSLHTLSREEMKAHGPANPPPNRSRVAAFGITYLDEMLARLQQTPAPETGLDDQGLLVQSNTALIGEIATQKTSLATAFLARTFRAFAFALADVVRELRDPRNSYSKIRQALEIRLCAAAVISGADPISARAAVRPLVAAAVDAIRARNVDQLQRQLGNLAVPLSPTASPDASRRARRRHPQNGSLSGPECIPFAAWLAEALPDNGAAVLVTSSSQERDGLTTEFQRWLENSISKAFDAGFGEPAQPDEKALQRSAFEQAVREHIKQRTICRRLELHSLSSPILIQIIQQCVQRAQEKVFLSGSPKDRDRLPFRRSVRFARSWNIRVVIDDLSTLKDTYPDIGSDPLFLPFLLSYLENEGVTSLIVDSQIGRPDLAVNDPLDRELRALVPHKLLTWRVPFYGGIRDAITVVPPYPSGLNSVVREVRWESRYDAANALLVDPDLELYSKVEKGEPTPIPLEVRLYVETESGYNYVREENEIFTQLFTAVRSPEPDAKVIVGVQTGQYNALRDFCSLQTDTLLDHTLVFEVDEFWATGQEPATEVFAFPKGPISRREGALYPLTPYLTERTSKRCRQQPPTLVTDRITDPFGLFQGQPSWIKEQKNEPRERREYFTPSSQGSRNRSNKLTRTDRVPFTWDFGFLLCPKSLWDIAKAEDVNDGSGLNVGQVWEKIPNVLHREEQKPISWRTFLGACQKVAEAHTKRSSLLIRILDVSTLAPESFVCLVLEIWASEIWDLLAEEDARQKFVNSISYIDSSSPSPEGLRSWLQSDTHLLAFFKTWLLLLDTLDLKDLVDRTTIPRLKERDVDGRAVATRHWYKTACGRQLSPLTNELSLPVRLPGHFSVRGDWFLAVAGGSRSERLGRRALDLFSSRRANLRRMELGIGLPTRDVAPKGTFDLLPTALAKRDHEGNTTAVMYGELIGDVKFQTDGNFHWLWRSQLHGYHRHSRLLHKWMGQMIARWDDLRTQPGPQWPPGFEIYDLLKGSKTFGDAPPGVQATARQSWDAFLQMVGLLQHLVGVAIESMPKSEPESDRPARTRAQRA